MLWYAVYFWFYGWASQITSRRLVLAVMGRMAMRVNFWHSDTLALSSKRQSAWMSKIINGGLDQYSTESFEQQQFETSGIKGVNVPYGAHTCYCDVTCTLLWRDIPPPLRWTTSELWWLSGWIVWHNGHSQQHTYMSSSYRSNRLGLSHRDPYAVRRGGCLELYYCNMVMWFWWDSSLISTTNWFPSVLWHCWFGHLACKNRPRNDL